MICFRISKYPKYFIFKKVYEFVVALPDSYKYGKGNKKILIPPELGVGLSIDFYQCPGVGLGLPGGVFGPIKQYQCLAVSQLQSDTHQSV